MDCLPNTGLDLIPFLVVGLLIIAAGVFLTVKAKKTKAGWGALIAIPLLLGVGIAAQPTATASAATSDCAPATATPTVTPTPTPTPTQEPVGCQLVNDKSPILDTDGDGIVNACDADSDNDGIPDSVEDVDGNGRFEDDDDEGNILLTPVLGDSVPTYLDLDSDNDSILDLFESGVPSAVIVQIDADKNGIIDPGVAVGANGLADILETTPDSGVLKYPIKNATSNDKLDFLDVESDGVSFDLHLAGNESLDDLYGGYISRINDSDKDGIQLSVDTDPTHRGAPESPIPTWY